MWYQIMKRLGYTSQRIVVFDDRDLDTLVNDGYRVDMVAGQVVVNEPKLSFSRLSATAKGGVSM